MLCLDVTRGYCDHFPLTRPKVSWKASDVSLRRKKKGGEGIPESNGTLYSFRSRPQLRPFVCWVLLLRQEQANLTTLSGTGKGLKAMAKTLRIFLVPGDFPPRFQTNMAEISVTPSPSSKQSFRFAMFSKSEPVSRSLCTNESLWFRCDHVRNKI
jgi:hypothetical protein